MKKGAILLGILLVNGMLYSCSESSTDSSEDLYEKVATDDGEVNQDPEKGK